MVYSPCLWMVVSYYIFIWFHIGCVNSTRQFQEEITNISIFLKLYFQSFNIIFAWKDLFSFTLYSISFVSCERDVYVAEQVNTYFKMLLCILPGDQGIETKRKLQNIIFYLLKIESLLSSFQLQINQWIDEISHIFELFL